MKLLDLIAGHAYAQTAIGGNANVSKFSNLFKFSDLPTGSGSGTVTLSNLIGTALNWLLAIAGIIAFIYLVLYGIKYITSGGDAAKATEARNGIINAIIGIIVIVLAFFIINFAVGIGKNLGTNNGSLNP